MKKIISLVVLFLFLGVSVFAQEVDLERLKRNLSELLERMEEAKKKGESSELERLEKEKDRMMKEIYSLLSMKKLGPMMEKLEQMIRLYKFLGKQDEAKNLLQLLERFGKFLPQGDPGKIQEVLEIKKKIAQLMEQAQKAKAEGQYEVAQKLLQEIQELEKRIRQGSPGDEKVRQEKLKELEARKQELLRNAEEAKTNQNPDLAEKLLKEAKMVEEKMNHLRSSNPGRERDEQTRKIKEQIQRLTDQAVGAKMRGDVEKTKALSGEIENLQAKLKEMENKDSPVLKGLHRIRRMMEQLSDEAEGAKARGDKKRYLELKNEIDKLQEKAKDMEAQKEKGKNKGKEEGISFDSVQQTLSSLLEKLEEARKMGNLKEFQVLLEKLEQYSRSIPSLRSPRRNPSPNPEQRIRGLEERLEQLIHRLQELIERLERRGEEGGPRREQPRDPRREPREEREQQPHND